MAGLFAQALGAGAYFFVRQAWRVLCGGGGVRPDLWRRHAPLCRDRARVLSRATHGHRCWGAATIFSCAGMALGPADRRLDLRHDRQLRLALTSARSGMGLGAMLIALLFPPFPSRHRAPAPGLDPPTVPSSGSMRPALAGEVCAEPICGLAEGTWYRRMPLPALSPAPLADWQMRPRHVTVALS